MKTMSKTMIGIIIFLLSIYCVDKWISWEINKAKQTLKKEPQVHYTKKTDKKILQEVSQQESWVQYVLIPEKIRGGFQLVDVTKGGYDLHVKTNPGEVINEKKL